MNKDAIRINIENHYTLTELENKLFDLHYPIKRNETFDRMQNDIYQTLQEMKKMIEDGNINYNKPS